MKINKLQTKLYDKMFSEQENFREWLLGLPKEEILNHAYTFSVREDILYYIDDTELSENEYEALLALSNPFDEICQNYFCFDNSSYMEDIGLAVSSTAEKMNEAEGEKNE